MKYSSKYENIQMLTRASNLKLTRKRIKVKRRPLLSMKGNKLKYFQQRPPGVPPGWCLCTFFLPYTWHVREKGKRFLQGYGIYTTDTSCLVGGTYDKSVLLGIPDLCCGSKQTILGGVVICSEHMNANLSLEIKIYY